MRPKLAFTTLEKADAFDPFGFEAFEYNGRPASDLPIFKPRPHAPQLFYNDERAERNILLNGLLLVDSIPVQVRKRKDQNPPDYDVTLTDGRNVFVEVTKGTTDDEERLNNTVLYFKACVEGWARAHPSVQTRVQGWNLTFDIASWVPNAHFREAFREAKRFLTTENFADYARRTAFRLIPEAYPVLRALHCTIICMPFPRGGAVSVKVSARSVGGMYNDAAALWVRIQGKIGKAQKWTARPMWLIVYQGLPWKTQDTLSVVRQLVADIVPFERVILCEGRHGLLIEEV